MKIVIEDHPLYLEDLLARLVNRQEAILRAQRLRQHFQSMETSRVGAAC